MIISIMSMTQLIIMIMIMIGKNNNNDNKWTVIFIPMRPRQRGLVEHVLSTNGYSTKFAEPFSAGAWA